MLAIARATYHQTSPKVDLYETLKLPIYDEFMSLTGSYELSILLNQIAYSSKKELTLYDIRRITLTDKTPQTLRKKLDTLIELGLINKRRDILYGKYLYSAKPDIYPNDTTLLALVEGLDLREYPCYLSASILNKFRQLALENVEDVIISANELRKLLGTEKSASLVRLILKRLVDKGYLQQKLIGVVYSYKINVQKFLNVLNPSEAEEQAKSLSELFATVRRSVSDDVTSQKQSSFKTSFKRMLLDGFNANVIKHLIAFIGVNREKYHFIKTPAHLRKKYEELNSESTLKLSKRKANKFIYKLMNGMLKSAAPSVAPIEEKLLTIAEAPAVTISDIEAWQRAKTFIDNNTNMLERWYFIQSAGVRDVDFEDYKSQAIIEAFKIFKSNKRHEFYKTGIKYRLQDYMYGRRSSDKDVNKIIQFYGDDISSIADIIGNVSDIYIEKESPLNTFVKGLFEKLDDLTAYIISDYHGLDGISYTFQEIAERHGVSQATACNRYHAGIERLRTCEPPPDFQENDSEELN